MGITARLSAALRRPRTGIGLAALACTGLCLVYAALVPALSTHDEAAHLDYAYQVWHHRLPVFEQGLEIDPPFGERAPVQWVAQHPPMFYALLAPAVGPLVDAGHDLAAVYAARAINAVLAGLLVVAVAWARRHVLPHRPAVWVAAAIVTACCSWVVRVGGAVYNDVAGALAATLVLGATAAVVRRGPGRARVLVLWATCAAALATRASLAVVVAVCLGTLAVRAVLVHRGEQRAVRRTLAEVAALVGLGLLMIVPSAWFWVRNVRLTGSVLGGHPEWSAEHLHRVTEPWLHVALDPHTWWGSWSLFSYGPIPTRTAMLLLLLLPAAVGLVVLACSLVARRRQPPPRDPAPFLLAVLLAGTSVAVFAAQISFTSGGGGINPRYVLPLMLPVAVLVAVGLSVVPRVAPVLVTVWTVTTCADLAVWAVRRVHAVPRTAPSPSLLLAPHQAPISPTTALVAGCAAAVCVVGALVVHALVASDDATPTEPTAPTEPALLRR